MLNKIVKKIGNAGVIITSLYLCSITLGNIGLFVVIVLAAFISGYYHFK